MLWCTCVALENGKKKMYAQFDVIFLYFDAILDVKRAWGTVKEILQFSGDLPTYPTVSGITLKCLITGHLKPFFPICPKQKIYGF